MMPTCVSRAEALAARVLLTVVLGVACGGTALRGQADATASTIQEMVEAFLHALPQERAAAAAGLRARGDDGARALLAALPTDRAPSSRVFDFLLDIAPAAATVDVLRWKPHLDLASRRRLVSWLARRDLRGVREYEEIRATALLEFVTGEDRELATRAAEALAAHDLDLVAKGLARSIESLIESFGSRSVLLACARAFAALRAAESYVDDLLSLCEREAPWLVGSLLPAFRRKPEAVLAGRLDAWCRARSPAIAMAFDQLISNLDRDLLAALDHERRVALFAHFRTEDPSNPEWPLREAHAALMDLGDPRRALAPLEALERFDADSDVAIESAMLHAVATLLAGGEPARWLQEALRRSNDVWRADAPLGLLDRLLGEGNDDFALTRAWREQLAPELGDDEFELRRRRFMLDGGTEGARWRLEGRRRIALRLLGAVMLGLEGKTNEAARWYAGAGDVVTALESDWDFATKGEPGDVEAALAMRCGPFDLLERALEGNESSARRVGKSVAERRRDAARRGFRSLVEGLASVLPTRVLPLPSMSKRAPTGTRERGYLDVTGAYARFLHRLGEEEEASSILARLIAELETAGLWRNRRAWAGYLFDHAGIEIDRRNAAGAKASLEKYIEHYEDALRDVRQAPERYVDAKVAGNFFASRLASGHISMAVLHNVVLGKLDVAREHCRQAYALEDNPFNRVLYACYLARDGKSDEAAALLSTVDPGPQLYYNMACTYALSGDQAKALEYLELDLEWNHATVKARNRQREWAAKDRDLESLRADPRFIELVRQR